MYINYYYFLYVYSIGTLIKFNDFVISIQFLGQIYQKS